MRQARAEFIALPDFKQRVAELYNEYSSRYDDCENTDWHLAIAERLVDVAKLKESQRVLDIATGTGMAALEAARQVGPTGTVLGVDIAERMLDVARAKIQSRGVKNVTLQLADAEQLDFPHGSFDVILCSSALIWMDLVPALTRWRPFLSPNGTLAFHGFSDTSFVRGVVMREVAANHNIEVVLNKPTDTPEDCQTLMRAAGYADVRVVTEHLGVYIPLDKALRGWQPASTMIHPVNRVDEEEMKQMGEEYRTRMSARATEYGVWDERTVHYAIGKNPS